MARIYFKNEHGQKVIVEVPEEVAKSYKECLQEEWRLNAYEEYYTTSLESIADTGYEFADENAEIEKILESREELKAKKIMLDKLRRAMPKLTDLQRSTVHKLFVLNMTQADIAKEEGVARMTIKDRVDGIYKKLKKLMQDE